MHTEALLFLEMARDAAKPKPDAEILDIGAYNVNGTARTIFHTTANYIGIDTRPGPGVDIVADGKSFTWRKKFDVVICAETLEHTIDAPLIVANAYNVLKRGGLFVVTAATDPRAPHGNNGLGVGPGEFYRNIPEPDLREWLSVFSKSYIECDDKRGDIYAWAIK